MTGTAPLQVLLVEDEQLLLIDLAMQVEDAGHRVLAEATSLAEVEALDPASAPDLALVDMQLAHGSSGLDVCALIRRQWPQTFVVFVTANPKMIPPDFAGAQGVISKPYSQSGLVATLRYFQDGGSASPPPSFVPSPAFAQGMQPQG